MEANTAGPGDVEEVQPVLGPVPRAGAPVKAHVVALPRGPLAHLATVELVGLVAGISTARHSVTCRDIGAEFLASRARESPCELAQRLQLPMRAATRLACAFELGRRAAASRTLARPAVRTPRDAYGLVRELLHGRDRETVVALYLDGRHRLLLLHEVSIGTATASLIHPREVFGPALRSGACAVVIAHNHPSGDPEPSAEDRSVTERLHTAGELLGVPLLDHIVVGHADFVSLRGRGAWQGRP